MWDSHRHDHFIAMLGSCWDAARLGGMRMSLRLDDDTEIAGHPTLRAGAQDDEDEVDSTGVARTIELDGEAIDVQRVRGYGVLWAD